MSFVLEKGMPVSQTQLLCTFTTVEELPQTLKRIIDSYAIAFDTIYVLENVDDPNSLCCTYNILANTISRSRTPLSTISLHRKKATNTLYTINALNMLVAELNGGVMDKHFMVPWERYKNTILVTAYDKLKKIHTKLNTIIKVNELR
jgi:hypothetical protein